MTTTTVKDSSEYGWQTISRDEYEKMCRAGTAGPGTPLNPDASGVWAMTFETGIGTVLYTGVSLEPPLSTITDATIACDKAESPYITGEFTRYDN